MGSALTKNQYFRLEAYDLAQARPRTLLASGRCKTIRTNRENFVAYRRHTNKPRPLRFDRNRRHAAIPQTERLLVAYRYHRQALPYREKDE